MTKSTIGIGIAAVVVGLLLFVSNGGMSSFGGTYHQTQEYFPAITIGANGSTVSQVVKGTCSLIAPSFTSLAASTSLPADCAVTGVVSGDLVFASFATSSPTGTGWVITGASASSTSGYITVRFVNNTGTAATIPASIASSTQFIVIR